MYHWPIRYHITQIATYSFLQSVYPHGFLSMRDNDCKKILIAENEYVD